MHEVSGAPISCATNQAECKVSDEVSSKLSEAKRNFDSSLVKVEFIQVIPKVEGEELGLFRSSAETRNFYLLLAAQSIVCR